MTFAPVVVVESGGVPFTQVAEGVGAPPFTVVESGAPAITLVESGGAPIALFNRDGTPYQGGGWKPSDLGASLLAWWSADRADLMTLVGSQVSAWTDSVGGRTATQAIGAARPTYSATSFNGAPAVSGDGGDDILGLDVSDLPSGSAPSEIWVVGQNLAPVSDTATRRAFAYGGAVNNDSRWLSQVGSAGANRIGAAAGTGTSFAGSSTTVMTTRHVERGVISSTGVSLEQDGVSSGPPVAGVPATGATRIRLFASTGGIGFWNGPIRDIIVTEPLSSEQAIQLLTYLLARRSL